MMNLRQTRKNIYWITLATILLTGVTFGQMDVSTEGKSNIQLAGLGDVVTVRRDARSIPYIEAKNAADLYFMQGFETARDRLWQMDLYRRVARGRLAELFGKRVLEEDKRWRRFGFSEIAEESLRTLDPKLRMALADYSRGVNAFIASLDEKTLPIEFKYLQYKPEPWKPTDTLVMGKILADGLSTTWQQDLQRIGLQKLSAAKYAALTNKITPSDVVFYGHDLVKRKVARVDSHQDLPALSRTLKGDLETARLLRKSSLERVGFYAENLAASNNWVISGKRTMDGNAILANDPHLPGTAPGIWYMAHLSSPEMKASGVTFAGVPGIILGHNKWFAWGATNVGPDVQDVYFEEFREDGKYKTTNGWIAPRVRKEEIKFRANPFSPKMTSETIEVVETRNGVIIGENGGKKIALKWTARNPANPEFESFFRLNYAKDWKGFRGALENYGGSTQNFVYVDVNGNIGWQVAGAIPIRKIGEGSFPYDGETDDGDWVGRIPFDELPRLYNPSSGFIVTANQRIVGTNYKYQQINRRFAGPWRARRIYGLIDSNKKITVEDVKKIQHDSFNIPLSKFVIEILKRKAASAETINLLRTWDGRMTANSVAATLADEISSCVGGEIAENNKPASQWFLRQSVLPWAIPANDKLWLPKNYKNWSEFLKSCDGKARRKFDAENEKKKWGAHRAVNFSHPFAAVPLIGARFRLSFTNVDGSGQSPNVGANVSMRYIATPADWDKTFHIIPLGQSGDPKSIHWKDQFEKWRSGESWVFPFSEKAVAGSAESTTEYSPK